MTTEEARTAVKNRLGIPSGTTTWDTIIDDFVVAAVRRLYPKAALEVAKVEITSSGFTVDNLGECEITLSGLTGAPLTARKVEGYDGYGWAPITDTYTHAGVLRLREVSDEITTLRVYGLKNFAAIDKVYDWLLQAVLWFAMSEFYDYLASNKSSYNIYSQVSGARAVDNMADQSAYLESKAERFLEDQKQSYGA
jgi:hypothetical protein